MRDEPRQPPGPDADDDKSQEGDGVHHARATQDAGLPDLTA
jgi:hypothetical protein